MTPARHALLVGVSYSPWMLEHRDRCPGYQRLDSVARDVDLMRAALVENFGFAGDDIRVLSDSQATQAAILDVLDEISEQAGTNDIVFFYFSGHGSGMRDPRDPARKLATIAPFDTGRRPALNRDLPSLVFDSWVRRLNQKTANVTLIFDCCHAAHLGRDPFGRPARGTSHDSRSIAEMFDDSGVPSFFNRALERPTEPMLISGWLPAGRKAVVVGACRADELSWEIRRESGLDTFHYGPLTYHLARAFNELGPTATWRDILEVVAPRVVAEQSAPERRQHPQIEGDLDRVVYGLEEARAKGYLPVVSVDAGSSLGKESEQLVELWGGAAHRVRPGSLWSIRPHGTRDRNSGQEVARVRIRKVRPATSQGVVEDSLSADLEAGQRAFLVEVDLARPGLTVAVSTSGDRHEEIINQIQQSPLLALADSADETSADVLLRHLEPRGSVGVDTPCPFLGPLTEPTWAAVGAEGQLVACPRTGDGNAAQGLITDLEKLARFRGLKSLENPNTESPLAGQLELRILDRHGQTLGASADGIPVVEEGDSLDFEIVSHHTAPVWISLIELASDYAITVILPRRGHPSFQRGGYRLVPGQALRIGRDYYGAESGLEQYLPEGFPWAGDGKITTAVACLKLLVTSVPADFEFLEQEKTRVVPTHPLRKLALLYHSNTGTRRVILAADQVENDKDWTAVTREVGVRRLAS